MPIPGAKYKRKIFTRDEDDAKEVCERLSEYQPSILNDEFCFYRPSYRVVTFKATVEEYKAIKQQLGLVYSQIIVRSTVHNVWMYEKRKDGEN